MHYICLGCCQLGLYKTHMKCMDISREKQLKIYERLIDCACKQEIDAETGIACTEMFCVSCEELKKDDPFHEEKVSQNREAKALLPYFTRSCRYHFAKINY